MKMMSCQKFEGFWDDLDQVNKIAKTNINDIENRTEIIQTQSYRWGKDCK